MGLAVLDSEVRACTHTKNQNRARLILGRFRDAVLPDPHSPSSSGVFFDVFSSDPCRGVYRGRYVLGA